MTKRIFIYIVIPLFTITLLLTLNTFKLLYRNSVEFHKKELQDFAYSILLSQEEFNFEKDNLDRLHLILSTIDRKTAKRFTIIDSSGKVLIDTREDPSLMDNHKWRPEISSALMDSVGFSLRYSQTLRTRMLYCAVPIKDDNKIVAILRVSEPESKIVSALSSTRKRLLLASVILFMLSIAALIAVDAAYRRDIREFVLAFKELSKNNLSVRILRKGKDYLWLLAEYFNEMADRIKQTFTELTQREAEINFILESVPFPLAMVDVNRTFIYANQEFKKLFLSKRLDDENLTLSDFTDPEIYENVREAFRTETKDEFRFSLRKDGRQFQVSVKKLKDLKHVLIIAMDITDTVEKERIKRDLINYVSHDLRTPLTIIKGYSETALDECKDKNIRTYLEKLLDATKDLQELVEKLNALSKMENIPEISLQEVNIEDLVKSIAQPFEHYAKSKGLNFEVDVKASGPVSTDPEKLKMMLVNLLDNAVKFTEEGSIKLCVTIEGEKILLSVSDTGPGIPEEFTTKIFERFFTLDKSRGAGFGLGLAIVKHAVKSLGGNIEVISKVGQGTTFTIEIPIVKKS